MRRNHCGDKKTGELLEHLNNLRDAIKTGTCRYAIEDVLAFLGEYADAGFGLEERYMRMYEYPQYSLHKEKHRQFADEIHFLGEELRSIRLLGLNGSYELSVETVRIIADWIRDHVSEDDRELRAFLGRVQVRRRIIHM